jgi:hypothetical protein
MTDAWTEFKRYSVEFIPFSDDAPLRVSVFTRGNSFKAVALATPRSHRLRHEQALKEVQVTVVASGLTPDDSDGDDVVQRYEVG